MVSEGQDTSSVMVIIEHLSAAECRMRSVHGFPTGTQLEFTLSVHGAPTVPLRGKIVSSKQNGPRYAYVVALQNAGEHSKAIAKANDAARAPARPRRPRSRASRG